MTAAANVPDPPTKPSRSAACSASSASSSTTAGSSPPRSGGAPSPTPPRQCCFGTTDIALILARISRGLHRANALEARLLRNADRLDAAPRGASSPAQPRAPRPAAAPSADEADARLAHLPTPEQIAAEVRRQPIGAVIADICRDLGIMPSHPLWRELQIVIISECGNFASLVKDILDQAFPIAAAAPPGSPAPPPRFGPVRTGAS